MHLRFIFRELVHSRGQGLVFILCVALSCLTMVSVSSLGEDIRRSVVLDGRSLHGGDLIIHSHYSFSQPLEHEISQILLSDGVRATRTWEFYSMARDITGSKNLLASVKSVDGIYPLYGEVELASGRSLAEALRPGTVVVGQTLLERMGLRLGDRLQLGALELEISDVVRHESSRPVEFFNFGPRIFVNSQDLDGLKLLSGGSRVRYEMLFRLGDDISLPEVVSRLRAVAGPGEERISTFAENRSPLKRFYNNLLFFLSLISIFIMLLSGISMGSSLESLFRSRRTSIGAMRALGATGRFIISHYLFLVLLLAVLGIGGGLVAGVITRTLTAGLFSSLLPAGVSSSLSPLALLEGAGFGLLVVIFFTTLPLLRLRDVRPVVLLGRGGTEKKNLRMLSLVAAFLAFVLLLGGLLVFSLGDIGIALWLLVGLVLLFVFTGGVVSGLLSLLRRLSGRSLAMRQAVRSLLRKGNATRSIIITLSSALALLFGIFLLAANLRTSYIDAYPEDAPNLFCLDIQPDQQLDFHKLTDEGTELFPVIRARLKAINNRRIGGGPKGVHFGDTLAREFNLSYRSTLLSDERLIDGKTLFSKPDRKGVVPVSILDRVAKMGDMEVGDILHFNIQGVPVVAKISSIRSRTRSLLHPFFYFIFPPEVLEKAPHTFFAALKVKRENLAEMENRIVNRFPNVSTINVNESARRLERVAKRFFGLVTFFASFALLAGALVFISSILATRLERMREVVYYTVLGAGRRFVLKVFFNEHLLLALMSGGCGIVVAELLVWGLCRYLLETPFQPFILEAILGLFVILFVLLVMGFVGSLSILRAKPMAVLRGLD